MKRTTEVDYLCFLFFGCCSQRIGIMMMMSRRVILPSCCNTLLSAIDGMKAVLYVRTVKKCLVQ